MPHASASPRSRGAGAMSGGGELGKTKPLHGAVIPGRPLDRPLHRYGVPRPPGYQVPGNVNNRPHRSVSPKGGLRRSAMVARSASLSYFSSDSTDRTMWMSWNDGQRSNASSAFA